jgi:hypothetical protein
MRAVVISAIIVTALLSLAHQCLSQIGETKDELIRRYGACQPNVAGMPRGPNVYDSVIDVGDDCTFQREDLAITSMFKAGKAMGFDYRKEQTFWGSLLHGKSYLYRELSDEEISTLLRVAVPGAQWVAVPSDSIIRRWQTSDSSAFAYYFASGHYNRHHLFVQTAAVDTIFKKVDKVIRGLRPP